MADRTGVEWCDSTFQGWTGCSGPLTDCDMLDASGVPADQPTTEGNAK